MFGSAQDGYQKVQDKKKGKVSIKSTIEQNEAFNMEEL